MKPTYAGVGLPSRAALLALFLILPAVLAAPLTTPAFADEQIQAPAVDYAQDYSAYEDAPSLAAPEVIIEDSDGNVLFSRNADYSMPMASTTKVMTAVVALESGVALDTVYTVSEYAASNQGSVIGYSAGEQVTLLDLLRGMLIHSGGDAAVGVAECVAGSEEAFVALMNQRASKLGLTSTHYSCVDGLSDVDHYSTARDLVTLARHAMQIPLFKSIVGSTSVTLLVAGQYVTYTNTDVLLNSYPGMQGVKTGYTYGAGRTFVGVASRGGQEIWFALLGEESSDARTSDMWTLLDWGFSKCQTVSLAQAGQTGLGYVLAGYRFGYVLATTVDADASLRLDPLDATQPSISCQPTLTTGTDFVMPGQVVGVINWTSDGSLSCARSVTAGTTLMRVRMFGPFVSLLFYELDGA